MNRRLKVFGGLFVALVSGFALSKLFRARREAVEHHVGLENGAVSAVTGGHPEEMNEMPPNPDDEDAEPVFDGHVLSRG